MLGQEPVQHLLDVATGTADLAIMAAPKWNGSSGIDISEGMLSHGRVKVKKRGLEQKITLPQADSTALPFADATFDAVTVAFGVRNFEDLERGLSEMMRVLQTQRTALRAGVLQATAHADAAAVPLLLPPGDALDRPYR